MKVVYNSWKCIHIHHLEHVYEMPNHTILLLKENNDFSIIFYFLDVVKNDVNGSFFPLVF